MHVYYILLTNKNWNSLSCANIQSNDENTNHNSNNIDNQKIIQYFWCLPAHKYFSKIQPTQHGVMELDICAHMPNIEQHNSNWYGK